LFNVQVLHKLSAAAPPKILVENYMIEIARTYKVPFEPDPLVMMVSVSTNHFHIADLSCVVSSSYELIQSGGGGGGVMVVVLSVAMVVGMW